MSGWRITSKGRKVLEEADKVYDKYYLPIVAVMSGLGLRLPKYVPKSLKMRD